jgi:hypothetical protein
LEANSPGYEITDEALIVWPKADGTRLVFPLRTWPTLDATANASSPQAAEREKWVFSAVPISWRRWVVTWELDHLGSTSKHQVMEDLSLLPS